MSRLRSNCDDRPISSSVVATCCPAVAPMVAIAPLLIITKLEQYDYAGATAIATMMLAASFVLLLAINVLQCWSGGNQRGAA